MQCTLYRGGLRVGHAGCSASQSPERFGHGVDATQAASARHIVIERPRRVDPSVGVYGVLLVVIRNKSSHVVGKFPERYALPRWLRVRSAKKIMLMISTRASVG